MCISMFLCLFFFKQKTAYEMRISDWSSDVCSSDLRDRAAAPDHAERLLERLGRNGGDERSVRAAYRLLERCRRVLAVRVDRQCGAKACSEVELAIVDVDRGHIETHGTGILHRHEIGRAHV